MFFFVRLSDLNKLYSVKPKSCHVLFEIQKTQQLVLKKVYFSTVKL